MAITKDIALIQKYVPDKFKLGASVEIDNSGYLLLRDSFISIFPSIMVYKDNMMNDFFYELRWSAYIILEGEQYLFISKSRSFASLKQQVEDSDMNLWGHIPPWYAMRIEEKDSAISKNIWETYLQKDVMTYIKLQHEYGFMLGENKKDKPLLFPQNNSNQSVYQSILDKILKDKVIRGLITTTKYKEIIHEYIKN